MKEVLVSIDKDKQLRPDDIVHKAIMSGKFNVSLLSDGRVGIAVIVDDFGSEMIFEECS